MNTYVFTCKIGNIESQSKPIEANTYNEALNTLYFGEGSQIDSADLMCMKVNNCWKSDIVNPTEYDILDPFKFSPADEYALAKRIGDKKYGSECTHEQVKSGHCLNCLRKVI